MTWMYVACRGGPLDGRVRRVSPPAGAGCAVELSHPRGRGRGWYRVSEETVQRGRFVYLAADYLDAPAAGRDSESIELTV